MLTAQNMVYIDSWVGFSKQVPRAFDTWSGIDQRTIHIAEAIVWNQSQNRQIVKVEWHRQLHCICMEHDIWHDSENYVERLQTRGTGLLGHADLSRGSVTLGKVHLLALQSDSENSNDNWLFVLRLPLPWVSALLRFCGSASSNKPLLPAAVPGIWCSRVLSSLDCLIWMSVGPPIKATDFGIEQRVKKI